MLPVSSLDQLGARKFVAPTHFVSGALMTFLIQKPLLKQSYISIQIHQGTSKHSTSCLIPVTSTLLLRSASCVGSLLGSVSLPSISYQMTIVSDTSLIAPYEVVQLSLIENTQKMVFSETPVVLDAPSAFMIGFSAFESEKARDSRREEDSFYETQENISVLDPEPTGAPFYTGPRIAGIVIGIVAAIVVIAVLLITMLTGGQKSVSNKNAIVMASMGGSPISNSNHDPAHAPASTTTASTGSHSPNSAHTGIPLASGVISASMSSAMKGAYSMSPQSDTPLQGELVGTHTMHVLSPRLNENSYRPSGGHNHAGTLKSGKKTERVALADTLLYSPRNRAPPKISNQTLASLPSEPSPKVKHKYLVAHQTSANATKPLSSAARQLRYHDLVPPVPGTQYGTYRPGSKNRNVDDSSSEGKNRRPKKKTISVSEMADEIPGDLDAFLGDDDGHAGLFTDEEDDWIDDIVEPHPDDPIYKNDDTYVEIDVNKLQLVASPTELDESAEKLKTHISQLESPLDTASATASRSSSSSSLSSRSPGSKSSRQLKKSKTTKPKISSPTASSSGAKTSDLPIKPKTAKALALDHSADGILRVSKSSGNVSGKSVVEPAKGIEASSSSQIVSGSSTPSDSIVKATGTSLSSSGGLSSSSSSLKGSGWSFARPDKK